MGTLGLATQGGAHDRPLTQTLGTSEHLPHRGHGRAPVHLGRARRH